MLLQILVFQGMGIVLKIFSENLLFVTLLIVNSMMLSANILNMENIILTIIK